MTCDCFASNVGFVALERTGCCLHLAWTNFVHEAFSVRHGGGICFRVFRGPPVELHVSITCQKDVGHEKRQKPRNGRNHSCARVPSLNGNQIATATSIPPFQTTLTNPPTHNKIRASSFHFQRNDYDHVVAANDCPPNQSQLGDSRTSFGSPLCICATKV